VYLLPDIDDDNNDDNGNDNGDNGNDVKGGDGNKK